MLIYRIKNFISSRKLIIENLSFMTFSQLFLLLYPLITYPYLIKILGREIYGTVLTAQMLSSYAAIIINFGTNFVCTRHISLNRNDTKKISEILWNVLFGKAILFLIILVIYVSIIFIIKTYRENFILFLLMFGINTQELLFPRFFFQGIEKLKFISILDICIKIIFLPFIFLLVKGPQDVLVVPIAYTCGYLFSGIASIMIIKKKFRINFIKPQLNLSLYYLKDSSLVFATDLVCTIKDKLNYLILGVCLGMSEIVIYDLCLKINSFISKPSEMICNVIFPRVAKSHNISTVIKTIFLTFSITSFICIVIYFFLDYVVYFFLNEYIDSMPLKVFLIVPIILSISYGIANLFFVSFGYNKYIFYSIIVTTIAYIVSLTAFYISHNLNNIMSFIYIALISYGVELIYRLVKARSLINNSIRS